MSRSRIENLDRADFLDFGSRLARTFARNKRFRLTAHRSSLPRRRDHTPSTLICAEQKHGWLGSDMALPQDIDWFIGDYVRAFNARDLERVASLYAEDATLVDPVGSATYAF